tara:strand:+ start:3718 stop:4014 length:297 start_codon:yes stop_codon:yes gene_type:complete
MEEGEKRFRDVLKLIILLQASLEQMDEIKTIPHLYRHDMKKSVNILEKKLEYWLRPLLEDSIPKDQEEIFMQIQRGVDKILDNTLEDIHNIKFKKDEI